MLVKKVEVIDVHNEGLLVEVMADLPINQISYANWVEEDESTPKVCFKIAHNGKYLFLHFFVEEKEILARTAEDNGFVWTDSCVEFFVSFDKSPYYYNAEFSCIGKGLMGYRKDRSGSERAGSDILSRIDRYPSLGTEPFDKRQGEFLWDILLVIPAEAYWKSDLKTFSGVEARANFYKCGDNLTKPHYLSWKPVKTVTPDFHTPQFFDELIFEK
jgi:hypothetical protein